MEQTITTPVRPAFLKVLCILTFVGAGLALLGSLVSIPDTFLNSTQEQVEKQMVQLEQAEQVMPGITDRMIDMILEMAPYRIPNWMISFIGNLLTLLAAILMWKQKKMGFYLYVAAELVPFIVSMGFLKGMKAMTGAFAAFGSSFESMGVVLVVVFLIFDLAFFIMYAVNLKHMK